MKNYYYSQRHHHHHNHKGQHNQQQKSKADIKEIRQHGQNNFKEVVISLLQNIKIPPTETLKRQP